jgi:hypothetical protein
MATEFQGDFSCAAGAREWIEHDVSTDRR